MLTRATEERDFSAIAALTNEFILNTPTHFGYEPVTPAELVTQWRETPARYPWLTAEVDGTFAGFAKAGVWRARTAYQLTAEIGIYMTASSRGRGLGKALYTTLIAMLRERGYHSVIGGITLPNAVSVRLHESLGFTHVGTFRHAGYKMNAWHDVGFWQLMLNDASHRPT